MNRSLITRILATVTATLAVFLGSISLSAPAEAVSPTGTPGQVYFRLDCQDARITITPQMSVQNGYFNGQYMVYRFYLTNGSTYSQYSGWSGSKLMPYFPLTNPYTNTYTYYGMTAHNQAVLSAARGHNWGVQIQIGYWNPNTRSYSLSGWYQPNLTTTLTRGVYDNGPLARCYT